MSLPPLPLRLLAASVPVPWPRFLLLFSHLGWQFLYRSHCTGLASTTNGKGWQAELNYLTKRMHKGKKMSIELNQSCPYLWERAGDTSLLLRWDSAGDNSLPLFVEGVGDMSLAFFVDGAGDMSLAFFVEGVGDVSLTLFVEGVGDRSASLLGAGDTDRSLSSCPRFL